MIKEVYTRKQAIAEFIHNNTGLISLIDICKSLYKYDGVFGDYVWLNQEEFDNAVRNWSASDIIRATPAKALIRMDFIHINETDRLFSGATVMALCDYFRNERVEDKVIKYLVNCEHGHTGDEILDGIVNATSDTLFDDSFYIYHAPEERPEDYDDGNY